MSMVFYCNQRTWLRSYTYDILFIATWTEFSPEISKELIGVAGIVFVQLLWTVSVGVCCSGCIAGLS